MEPEKADYHYHVFGLIRGNKKNIEQYVAEGALARSPPLIFYKKSIVAEQLCSMVACSSLDYGVGYMTFSFEPPCEKVMRGEDIYRTKKLSENEQTAFLKHISNYIKTHREK